MLNRISTKFCVIVFVLAFSTVGHAQTDFIWTGLTQSEAWSEGDNWQNGQVPTPGDQTRLIFPGDPAFNRTNNDLGDFELAGMEVDTGDVGYVFNGDTLTFLGEGMRVAGFGSAQMSNNLKFSGGGGIAANLSPGAEMTYFGSIDIDSGFLQGTMTIDNVVRTRGDTTIETGSVIDVNDITTIETGSLQIGPAAELRSQSQLIVSASANVDLQDGTIISDVFLEADSSISGNGRISGTLFADGIITPGNSAGTLDVDGDVDMSDTTLTCIELGGTGVGDHDLINGGFSLLGPGNRAFLDGDLEVSLIDGYMPSASDEIFFIQGFAIEGTFDNTGGSGGNFTGSGGLINVGGGRFKVEYGADFVRLHSFAAIPEPGSTCVLAFFALACCRRRRRSG